MVFTLGHSSDTSTEQGTSRTILPLTHSHSSDRDISHLVSPDEGTTSETDYSSTDEEEEKKTKNQEKESEQKDISDSYSQPIFYEDYLQEETPPKEKNSSPPASTSSSSQFSLAMENPLNILQLLESYTKAVKQAQGGNQQQQRQEQDPKGSKKNKRSDTSPARKNKNSNSKQANSFATDSGGVKVSSASKSKKLTVTRSEYNKLKRNLDTIGGALVKLQSTLKHGDEED